MNKTELVEAVAGRTDSTQKLVGEVIDALFEEVASQVSSGNKVTIQGCVAFEQVDRKARMGHNPQTGEKIQIPATKAIKVKALSKLKEAGKGN